MRLKSINYSEFDGTPREWSLSGLTLGAINLIVGKNGTGKTRSLNIIVALGNLLSGRQKPELTTGTWKAEFEHDDKSLHYLLGLEDRKVIREEFKEGDRTLLQRGRGGSGSILYEKEGRVIEFQPPESDLAAVARVDKIQHSFLEPLREWGQGVRHYLFGETMGKPVLAFLVKDGPAPDPKDVNAVIGLYRKGARDFPEVFQQAVLRDVNAIGYDVEEVGVMAPTDIEVQSFAPVSPMILYVKERDLAFPTQQPYMSQGMFRALSIVIHLNYAVIASKPNCIVVDDIGEGLDFERSCKLIDLLRTRAQHSTVQLILSTNDKFVMNEIPLDEWCVLQRNGGHVRVRNYENSKALFEDFKFTGLSNFSFFEMDFANGTPEEVAATHE
jgi:predicted ATPase